MTSIDVLVIGGLSRKEDGSVDPKQTWSTSTLIRTEDGHNIVVDTSQDYMKAGIKTSLKQIGKVFPEDIDMLVLTHMHGDHIGNNGLFKNARIYVHAGEENIPEGAIVVDKDMDIAKGVRLVGTPGHTTGSMSVFIKADKKYAIVGDAMPLQDNYLKMVPPASNCDEELAKESMKKIIEFADVIVPGHDAPFITKVRGSRH